MMEDGSQWMMLLRALGSLALVVGLILALAYVAKRFFRADRWAPSLGSIRVVQSLPIGTKKKLMLVEVEGRRVLIGVGQDTIHGICELGETPALQANASKEISYASLQS